MLEIPVALVSRIGLSRLATSTVFLFARIGALWTTTHSPRGNFERTWNGARGHGLYIHQRNASATLACGGDLYNLVFPPVGIGCSRLD